MSLIRLLLRRRRFLATLLSSAFALAFGKISQAFGIATQTSAEKATANRGTGGKKSLKGIVVYYSGTGNTAQIAYALYRGMKSVIACDVAPINRVKPADMAKYDVMALGSPNWYMREVVNTKIFTHDMPRMDGKHCIIFGTHGGSPVGQFWSMSRNVLKKGMTIIGWSDWYGSDFMTPHSSYPDGEWGHPDSIDLAEAEAFGKRMAEYSIRIYAGEKELVPEIPQPDLGQQNLWSPLASDGNITFASPPPDSIPHFDLAKCVYPRCTQCVENCPANAIDFSVLTAAGSIISKDSIVTQDSIFAQDLTKRPDSTPISPLILKEACQHCGGICQRVCLYDAIAYAGEKIQITVNTKKCTYPKCTACIDECPQSCMDFARYPQVVIHNHCEAEGLCWGVCPENAIEVPNMAEIQLKKAWWFQGGRGMPGGGRGEGPGGPTPGEGRGGGPGSPIPGGGRGEGGPMPGMMMRQPARFRSLVRREDEETAVGILYITDYPRVPVNKTLWPYHIDKP